MGSTGRRFPLRQPRFCEIRVIARVDGAHYWRRSPARWRWPHGAVSAYVMDDRDSTQAGADDIRHMAEIAREGVAAGALGFSANWLRLHTSVHGDPAPGTFASEDELLANVKAFRETSQGLLGVAIHSSFDHFEAPEGFSERDSR